MKKRTQRIIIAIAALLLIAPGCPLQAGQSASAIADEDDITTYEENYERKSPTTASTTFGSITPPVDTLKAGGKWGNLANEGPIKFVNALISFISAVAGVWLLVTIIRSGITIITKGNSPDDFSKAVKNIMFAVIGMIIVALSYVIVRYVGYLLYGDATYITQPTKILESK